MAKTQTKVEKQVEKRYIFLSSVSGSSGSFVTGDIRSLSAGVAKDFLQAGYIAEYKGMPQSKRMRDYECAAYYLGGGK